MTALVNTRLQVDDSFAGERNVIPSEGECPPGRGAGGTMNRPPLDSLPYQAWVACQSCREVLHASELDEHFCAGCVW